MEFLELRILQNNFTNKFLPWVYRSFVHQLMAKTYTVSQKWARKILKYSFS